MANGTARVTDLRWDPYNTDLDDAPYEVWRRLRDEAPVYRNDEHDFWALSRYHDVEAAHRDPGVFSSAHGTVLEGMGPEANLSSMIIFTDPPNHARLRALVSRALTPRRVGLLEDRIRALCAELLDPHVGSPGFDYVVDFAAQLPSRVISTLVGVPPEDQEEQRLLVDEMFHIEPGVGMVNERSATAAMTVVGYLTDLVNRRRAHPSDDMVSALVDAELVDEAGEARRLTARECTEFALLLFTAGTETVAKLLGNAGLLLAQHPDQRRLLVRNPDIIPNAVEELLRYEAPSPVQGRWTTEAVTMHGVEIPKDSRVLLLTGSAGRDERAFPDPDRFVVTRQIAHHVSFGYGIHFCLGAALARLEGRVALGETLARFSDWEADPARAERVHTSTVRGYRSVPISLGAAAVR